MQDLGKDLLMDCEKLKGKPKIIIIINDNSRTKANDDEFDLTSKR